MGADFLSRTAKPFKKAWDRGRDSLDIPQLFDDQPELRKRTFLAKSINDHKFVSEAEYLLLIVGTEPSLFSGSEQVGIVPNLSQEVVDAIAAKGCGCAVAKVDNVAEISGMADVTVS